MPNHTPATVITPRARVIQRLLWTSLALTILTFAMSMVFFGFMSLFIALAGVGLCLIYDITLLALTAKERRIAAQGSEADTIAARPNSYPPSTNTQSPKRPLPCTLRKPSIIVAFFLVVVWFGSLGVLLYFLAYWYSMEVETPGILAVPILEVIFTISHIGVLGTYVVQTWKERRKWISGGGQLKWYQLGEYA